MLLDLNVRHDRETVIRALEAWARSRERRASELQPQSPMLSLAVREEAKRAAIIVERITGGR